MPLPTSSNPGTIIKFLKHEGKKMPHKQMVAIALSQARKAGADIPQKENSLNAEMKRRAKSKK